MSYEIMKAKRSMLKDCYHAEEILDIAMPFSNDSVEELYRIASELTRRDFRYEPKTREFHRIKLKGASPWTCGK